MIAQVEGERMVFDDAEHGRAAQGLAAMRQRHQSGRALDHAGEVVAVTLGRLAVADPDPRPDLGPSGPQPSRVEPSMSVNTNVTVPVGESPIDRP